MTEDGFSNGVVAVVVFLLLFRVIWWRGALHAVHVQIDCINVSLDYVAGPAVFSVSSCCLCCKTVTGVGLKKK